ncbi:hypothetical protein F5887DRAFT_920315 [Amanita rubescens]|nr:hypothetical protein F5887DRAFT_920315 [Amanita rubescens]
MVEGALGASQHELLAASSCLSEIWKTPSRWRRRKNEEERDGAIVCGRYEDELDEFSPTERVLGRIGGGLDAGCAYRLFHEGLVPHAFRQGRNGLSNSPCVVFDGERARWTPETDGSGRDGTGMRTSDGTVDLERTDMRNNRLRLVASLFPQKKEFHGDEGWDSRDSFPRYPSSGHAIDRREREVGAGCPMFSRLGSTFREDERKGEDQIQSSSVFQGLDEMSASRLGLRVDLSFVNINGPCKQATTSAGEGRGKGQRLPVATASLPESRLTRRVPSPSNEEEQIKCSETLLEGLGITVKPTTNDTNENIDNAEIPRDARPGSFPSMKFIDLGGIVSAQCRFNRYVGRFITGAPNTFDARGIRSFRQQLTLSHLS